MILHLNKHADLELIKLKCIKLLSIYLFFFFFLIKIIYSLDYFTPRLSLAPFFSVLGINCYITMIIYFAVYSNISYLT